MTKKHFARFAEMLKQDVESAEQNGENKVVAVRSAKYAANLFAALASEDNPRFDRDRFLKACGF